MPETKSNYGRDDGDKGGCEEKGTVEDRGDGDGEKSVWTSARSLGHQTPLSIVLGCTCGRSERIYSLIGDISLGEWEIILDSIQTRGLDQDLVNALREDITVAQGQVEPDFSLHFWRLSGSMNRVEECRGQDPRILRGRILARLRIKGMRRFNKTWRPKQRILKLDSTSLACAS
ncbi:hypothetical protein F2Q68_00032219 [Brassica cretica]|uniref:Uncharacterized protein n=1 Tax=Brassica cretica TaxID=69181 RepID=A0A8S9GBG2_BRACR|nr:hypothetical protein F2Q68_00032219 [Brassica cretica]